MAAEPEDGQDQTTVMYFLDVLSSGLGAAILLFLVFSVLPHFGDIGGQRSAAGADPAADAAAAGAAGDTADALARTAYVTVRVTVTAATPVASGAGRWEGLPSRAGDLPPGEERVAARPNEVTFIALCPRGWPSARKVRFDLASPPDGEFSCVVTVSVGGLVQQKAIQFAPPVDGQRARTVAKSAAANPAPPGPVAQSPGRPLPVAEIDLSQRGDWIRLP